MAATDTLYKEVVNVTYNYLGPAADRFVARQVKNHLRKKPDQLRRQDLAALIDWFSLAMAVLSEDTRVVNEYAAALTNLLRS